MIRIVKASLLKRNIQKQMSKIFVDCYYNYFKRFCTDKEKLYKIFKNSFNLNMFYCVLLDDMLIGFSSISDGFVSPIKLNRFKMYYYLGLSLGKRMYKYLKTIFIDRDYAFEIDSECAMLEFISIKEDYRNKKIGYTLVNHVMCDNEYKRYLAKVGDNNISARKILNNIGFELFDEESATGLEKEELGISNYLYMICDNPKFRVRG